MEALIRNRQRLIRINLKRIEKDSLRLLKSFALRNAELGVLLVGDRRMKELNRLHRSLNKTTDVLSFPQMNPDESSALRKKSKVESFPAGMYLQPLGDVVINLQAAKKQAAEYGLPFYAEVRRLLVHGFLHLLGFDHERSASEREEMERRERGLGDILEKMD